MQLDKEYSITGDKYNVILNYRSERFDDAKGRVVVSQGRTFHPDMASALRSYVTKVVRPSMQVNLILKKLNEVNQTIQELCERS